MSTNYSLWTWADLEAHLALGRPIERAHLERAIVLGQAKNEDRVSDLREELEEERDEKRRARARLEEAQQETNEVNDKLKAELGERLDGWVWRPRPGSLVDGHRDASQIIGGTDWEWARGDRRIHRRIATTQTHVEHRLLKTGSVYWVLREPGRNDELFSTAWDAAGAPK